MIIKEFNNLEEIQKYYDEESNTYLFKEDDKYIDVVILNFDLQVKSHIAAFDINAKNMEVWNIDASNIKANNIIAYEIDICNIDACDIKSYSIDACTIKSCSLETYDIRCGKIIVKQTE